MPCCIKAWSASITMKAKFDEMPTDSCGNPMLVATNEVEFQEYIGWLADYLHRPNALHEEPLSQHDAAIALIEIEIEIAESVWKAPFDDYPPNDRLPDNLVRHADILHRKSISLVLSRVPDQEIRVKLLYDFYAELNRDIRK